MAFAFIISGIRHTGKHLMGSEYVDPQANNSSSFSADMAPRTDNKMEGDGRSSSAKFTQTDHSRVHATAEPSASSMTEMIVSPQLPNTSVKPFAVVPSAGEGDSSLA